MQHLGQSSGRRASYPPASNQPRPGSSAGVGVKSRSPRRRRGSSDRTPGFGQFFVSARCRRRLVAIFSIRRGGGKMIEFLRFHSKAGARPRPGLDRYRGVKGGGLLLLSFCSNLYFFQHPVLTSPPITPPPAKREISPPTLTQLLPVPPAV